MGPGASGTLTTSVSTPSRSSSLSPSRSIPSCCGTRSVVPDKFLRALKLGVVVLWLLDSKFFLTACGNAWIVGGSCFGSPARMSFLALSMGIQQTCNVCKGHPHNNCENMPHSFERLGCLVDNDYIKFKGTQLVPARRVAGGQNHLHLKISDFVMPTIFHLPGTLGGLIFLSFSLSHGT